MGLAASTIALMSKREMGFNPLFSSSLISRYLLHSTLRRQLRSRRPANANVRRSSARGKSIGDDIHALMMHTRRLIHYLGTK